MGSQASDKVLVAGAVEMNRAPDAFIEVPSTGRRTVAIAKMWLDGWPEVVKDVLALRVASYSRGYCTSCGAAIPDVASSGVTNQVHEADCLAGTPDEDLLRMLGAWVLGRQN
jgi:hypothetical protein